MKLDYREEMLFGYPVISAFSSDPAWKEKYGDAPVYTISSIFHAFNNGMKVSTTVREKYCFQAGGDYSVWLTTYPHLREYCRVSLGHNRGSHGKPPLMKLIASNEEPREILDRPKTLENRVEIPDAATVEAATLREVVEKMGIGRVHQLLMDMGLVPRPELGPDDVKPAPAAAPKKIVITVEVL